jgi:DNA-binding NtrC family response regulator
MGMHSRILLVDDEEIVQIGITRYLSSKGYSVSQAFSLSQARSMIEKEVFDAVLLDVKLPDGISLDLIQDITAKFSSIPVIVISGMADVSTAVQAMRMGATNFITKPMEIEGLGLSIQKCLEHEELKKRESRSRRLKKAPMEPYFGNSPKWLQIRKFADVASKNDSVVLLTGETGTGKGVLAKWIHENSSRVAGNYVELNCSALRGELLRSELYGHVRGSFTSASRTGRG